MATKDTDYRLLTDVLAAQRTLDEALTVATDLAAYLGTDASPLATDPTDYDMVVARARQAADKAKVAAGRLGILADLADQARRGAA